MIKKSVLPFQWLATVFFCTVVYVNPLIGQTNQTDNILPAVENTAVGLDTSSKNSTVDAIAQPDSAVKDSALLTAIVSDSSIQKDSVSIQVPIDSAVANSESVVPDSSVSANDSTIASSDSSTVQSDSGNTMQIAVPDSVSGVDSLQSQLIKTELAATDSSGVKAQEQVADQKREKKDNDYKTTGLGVMLLAGSTGPQIGITGSVHQLLHCSRPINIRALFSYIQFKTDIDKTVSEQDLSININSRVSSANLLLDFHPLKNWLRISAGAFFSFTETKTKMQSKDGKSIGMITVTPEEMGNLEFTFSRHPVEPYLGVGIGNALEKRVNFLLDLGVAYTGPLKVKGKGTGMIGPSSDNAQNMQKVFENHNELFWWPVLSLGLGVKLF
jgi:hypothetical protein